MNRKNIFIVGLDDLHLAQLRSLRKADRYNYHPLSKYEEIRAVENFPVKEFLNQAEKELNAFPGSIDAIVGYWNFPVSTLLPILRRKFGLITPSLESVLKCEHKYWSRLVQAEVISDHIPRFAQVDPFAADPLKTLELDYPFWLKPVKSVLSHLGFRINNAEEFHQSLRLIRRNIARYAKPFNYLLSYADLSDAVAQVDGYHCIAEAIIAAPAQCTLEGYVFQGDVQIYGVIDSLREGPHESCFSSYRYPSLLPETVIKRMIALTKRVMSHIDYDNAPFNIEFFWDKDRDQLWLLEINTRISKSHCPLFYRVDGEYHHAVMIDVALGERPDFPYRQGRFNCAAKFMVRKYQDALVSRVPTLREIQDLEKQLSGTRIQIKVEKGMRLSQLLDQDSYSYEVAVLFIGADNEQELQQKYQRCLEKLSLELTPDPCFQSEP